MWMQNVTEGVQGVWHPPNHDPSWIIIKTRFETFTVKIGGVGGFQREIPNTGLNYCGLSGDRCPVVNPRLCTSATPPPACANNESLSVIYHDRRLHYESNQAAIRDCRPYSTIQASVEVGLMVKVSI